MSEIYTVREVADRYRVTPNCVRKWISVGKLAAVKTPGGSIRIRAEDLPGLVPSRPGE